MTGLIRTFLTDKEKLNRCAIHIIWSFWAYTEQQGLKKNQTVGYATFCFSKITTFSEPLKDRTLLRQYNILNPFKMSKNDYKCHKVLWGTTCAWRMQICFAGVQVRWWIAERTFLTSFSSVCDVYWTTEITRQFFFQKFSDEKAISSYCI